MTPTYREALPKPDCKMGYTRSQLEEILGDRLTMFDKWMTGQTMTLCQGSLYSYEEGKYEDACGGVAHGPVVYGHDLAQFLKGGRPLD